MSCTGSCNHHEWLMGTNSLLLDPLQTSIRMTYPFLKSTLECLSYPFTRKIHQKMQQMLFKLKILFAYVPITRKHPVLCTAIVCTYVHERCGKNAAAHSDSCQIIIHHCMALHDMTTSCVYQWPEISSFASVKDVFLWCPWSIVI